MRAREEIRSKTRLATVAGRVVHVMTVWHATAACSLRFPARKSRLYVSGLWVIWLHLLPCRALCAHFTQCFSRLRQYPNLA